MFVCKARCHSAARCALKDSDLEQIGFDDFLDGIFFFVERGAERAEADRAAVEFFDDRHQEFAVEFVKAKNVHFHPVKSIRCDVRIDDVVVIDLREIAYSSQKAICYPRRSARAAGDLLGAFGIDLDVENSRRTFDDSLQFVHTVKIEMKHYPEPAAKWSRYQTWPCCRADQRKFLQRHVQR